MSEKKLDLHEELLTLDGLVTAVSHLQDGLYGENARVSICLVAREKIGAMSDYIERCRRDGREQTV